MSSPPTIPSNRRPSPRRDSLIRPESAGGVTAKHVIRAGLNIYDLAKRTNCDELSILSEKLGLNLFIKREDEQLCRSFKIRGAYNAIKSLPEDVRARGIVAASAGNHAQGVAASAKHLGVLARIVMPVTTPEVKVSSTARLGGEWASVILHGNSFDEAREFAQAICVDEGVAFIPPYDDDDVIAGQGTCGLEILEQVPDLDIIVVPCGGGGLLAGIATIVKEIKPDVRVVCAEPSEAACCKAAFDLLPGHADGPYERPTLEKVDRFADGVAVKQIGEANFKVIARDVDECVTVSTDEISRAIAALYLDTRAIGEPGGVVGLAAVVKMASQWQGKTVATVLSGANINFSTLRYVAERCSTERFISVTMGNRQGALLGLVSSFPSHWQITELSHRYQPSSPDQSIFFGVGATDEEFSEWMKASTSRGQSEGSVLKIEDLTDSSLMKDHVRYMVGGPVLKANQERCYLFDFPESPGALRDFLVALGDAYTLSLFHYRNVGGASASVFAGWRPNKTDDGAEEALLLARMDKLGWNYIDCTDNVAYRRFLTEA